jgi:hypothetical protein
MSKHTSPAWKLLVTCALAFCLTAPVATSPAAGQQVAEGSGSSSVRDTDRSKPYERPCRVKRRAQDKSTRICNREGKVRVYASPKKKVSSKMVEKWGDVQSSDGTTLKAAYRAQQQGGATVYWRTFWQAGIDIYGINQLYNEKHEGMAFFNGDDVWVGKKGYHRCGLDREVGFVVETEECAENYKYMPSGTEYIQFWDFFTVKPLTSVIMPAIHYDMHVNVHESGTISFWFYDKKEG